MRTGHGKENIRTEVKESWGVDYRMLDKGKEIMRTG